METISVIILANGDEGRLIRSLDSLQSQESPQLDIVVADCLAQAPAAAMLAQRYAGAGNIRYLALPAGSRAGVIFNAAAQLAQGEAIAFWEAGTEASPGWAAESIRALLNLLTINSMCAGDTVLVPIQCEYYALEGLTQLMHTIQLVKDRLNPDLEIEGVVFTMYDARTNLSLQVVENVKNNLNQNIYKSIIPRNVRLAEAPSYGMPITEYDPKSTGAESYLLLAEEVIHRGEEEWQ